MQKSLQVYILAAILLFGILSAVLMEAVLLNSYEKRAAEIRMAEIQNQCTIFLGQWKDLSYLEGVPSEMLEAEVQQLSGIYNGRIMLIDSCFRICRDTYKMDEGKTIVSKDVMDCMKGEGTSHYDKKNKYIEVTTPVLEPGTGEVKGVMLVSMTTDGISDQVDFLREKGQSTLILIGVLLAGAGIVYGTTIVKPIRRIRHLVEGVTEGFEEGRVEEYTFTETKELSETLNVMLERMKALDESRNEFVSNVSHELKTPMTSMKVLADSLLAQPDVPVELYQEFMQDLSQEIQREDKIINDLLSLVKMDKTAEHPNVQTEQMNQLIEKILKRLRPIAEKADVELILESVRPVQAEVDEVKISLAISNLVENAIKYNKEGGWVRVRINGDHKFCYIEVSDSGIGMKEEDQEHIFERFYRADKSHSREIGGTGLGLSIARKSVVMHRGTVKVYSQPGLGSTFTVRIPLTYVGAKEEKKKL